MAFDHRKLLPIPGNPKCDLGRFCNKFKNPLGFCEKPCFQIHACPEICKFVIDSVEFVHPPPPPPYPHPDPQNHLLRTSMYLMICLISSALFCAIICTIIRIYFFKRNNRRREEAMVLSTQEDFVDENRGPQVDYPFWHIQFVGLPESVIESISMFKYKKHEGLFDGTDCSICLSEFEEDESLRLLPKCSHAFHVPCIDAWLRSHKTCPVCRAPIVKHVARVGISFPDVDDSGSMEGNLENHDHGDGNVSENGNRSDDLGAEETLTGSSSGSRVCGSGFRVLSDLVGNREVVEDLQRIRRSVSLNSPIRQGGYIENAEINLVKAKVVLKQESEGSSKSNMKKSCSVGSSLSKGNAAVKRSFSSGGKFLLFKDSRSQDVVLPL